MENVWIDSEILEAIGDALRYQYNTDKKYYPYEMAEAIKNAKGVGTIDDYFGHEIKYSSKDYPGWMYLITKMPKASPNSSTATSLKYVFSNCLLQTTPVIDSKGIKDFSYMFYGSSCRTILPFDTSEGTNFSYMFAHCSMETIPRLDTRKGTNFSYMFSGTSFLHTLPLLDVRNGTDFSSMFNGVYHIENLGGFLNIGQAYSTTVSANYSSYQLSLSQDDLTHESLMNVVNNLYDIATKGCKTQRLQIGWKNIAKLTAEEIIIATNKGWSVS